MARPREWTEQRAEALAKELEAWFAEDEERVFWRQFFCDRPDLHPDLISRLQSVSDVFRRTVKKIEEKCEGRLAQMMLKQKVNPVAAIFVLKNKHGWADKQEVKTENRNVNIDERSSLEKLAPEDLKAKIAELVDDQ